MLTIEGRPIQLCDGIPRRSFLKIGGLAMGGLTLPEILRAQEQAAESKGRPKDGLGHKAIIMIFLAGGAPHQDMVDLKPDAPTEMRGEFDPIATNVPGIQIGELMPRTAKMMDKFAIIRSLVGSDGRHDAFECCTGRHVSSPAPGGGWPAMGASLSKLYGPVDSSVPSYVDLSIAMAHKPWNIKGPGFLGMEHAPFRPDGDAMADMKLHAVTPERFNDRASLLQSLDRFRRHADVELSTGRYDTFTEQALGVLTSSKLVDALDIERETPEVRARYGKDSQTILQSGYPAIMSRFLMARRAVEAGARCVTCSFAHFDWHGNNFGNARKIVPMLDQGITALVQDLYDRGLEKDVTVLIWGEFGRTPRINRGRGRDHWPRVHAALLAGGGIRTGQVIGSTNHLAESAVDRPVHMQEVFATAYHNLGIDVSTATIPDHNGRPQYLVDGYEPMPELV
ncbi:MAG: DUF1501 domain-containing protein [Planctomycetes bacterium]|nr:DUF1501 domain-containing protein [Planctomycetota bacterium]